MSIPPEPASAQETPKDADQLSQCQAPQGHAGAEGEIVDAHHATAHVVGHDQLQQGKALRRHDPMIAAPAKKISTQESGSHRERANPAVAAPSAARVRQRRMASSPLQPLHGEDHQRASDGSHTGTYQQQFIRLRSFVEDRLHDHGQEIQ